MCDIQYWVAIVTLIIICVFIIVTFYISFEENTEWIFQVLFIFSIIGWVLCNYFQKIVNYNVWMMIMWTLVLYSAKKGKNVGVLSEGILAAVTFNALYNWIVPSSSFSYYPNRPYYTQTVKLDLKKLDKD
jgi:hypothetical protein